MTQSDSEWVNVLDDPSFFRWIEGKAPPKEEQMWERWEKQSPNHADIKQKALRLSMLPMGEFDGSDVEEQLAVLQRRIDENETIFRLSMQSRRRGRGKGYFFAIAAAVVLLAAVVGVFTFYPQAEPEPLQALYSTIETGYGERGLLRISDGSSIRLNANSSLRYSTEQFNSSTVEVWLEGEAFFSISGSSTHSHAGRAFIVHTPDGEVRVLGTRFNVNTRFRRTGVVLEEGTVEVVLKDFLQHVADRRVINAGQRAILVSGDSDIEVRQVNPLLYTAWLKGELVFEETPLHEIVQNIEATYGVYIEAEDPGLLNQNISGSFRNPDLATLIQGLEAVFDFHISKQNEKRYLISKQH